MSKEFNIQDFSIIEARVTDINEKEQHKKRADSFTWFILSLQDNVDISLINECITDTSFVANHSGHDRGIDAIYIDEDENEFVRIHFFNCKYTDRVDKSKQNNFPSAEIDKITSAIEDLFKLNIPAFNNCNAVLKDKINEVVDIIKGDHTKYELFLHFASNFSKGIEDSELKRLKERVAHLKSIVIVEDTLSKIVNNILDKKKPELSGAIQFSTSTGFVRADGNSRALIFAINAIDLLSLVATNEGIRENANFDRIEDLIECGLTVDAFDMNVRKYQRKRNRINKNIKSTVLSDENRNVFYYNNGITLVCSRFSYGNTASTILKITNYQVVNGCQTINSLFEALQENAEKLINVNLLCKLYEITDKMTYSQIAEYTNSQTKVTGRDLRSNDEIQKKLEVEFDALGYKYERKKEEHNPKDDLDKVLDSERVGQLIMAFKNDLPGFAKNKKSIIFGSEYENIFSDGVTALEIVNIYMLYKKIEDKRKGMEVLFEKDVMLYEKKHYVIYASYYFLNIFSKIMETNKLDFDHIRDNFDAYHQKASKIIEDYLIKKQSELKERYSASSILKGQNFAKYLSENKNVLRSEKKIG